MPSNLPAIVLVHPRNPRNIGAAARAMSNFGFEELILVAPHPPVWEEVLNSAIGADRVIATARVVETLLEAVASCSMVIGTVDPRRGVGLTPAMAVAELAAEPNRAALVFGPEKTGLTNEQLSYCHRILSIPTRDDCPSMNLGQAVAICCYEFSTKSETSTPPENLPTGLTPVAEVEVLLQQTIATLRRAEFLSDANEERMTVEMRRALLRFGLTQREITLWRGALHRIGLKISRNHQ